MTLDTHHPAVQAYLARLDAASAGLPPGRRAELRAEILSHLADAVPPDADDQQVRAALDRLGAPEDIVAAEVGDDAPRPAQDRPTGTTHEAVAVVMLTVGSVVPVAGWLVGLVLLWTSRVWTTREKLLGTLVFPGGPALGLFVAAPLALFTAEACARVSTTDPATGATVLGPETCTGGLGVPPWLVPAAFFLYLLLPFAVGFLLYRRAARRVAAAQGRAEGHTERSLGVAVIVAVVVALPIAVAAAVLLANLGASAGRHEAPPATETWVTAEPLAPGEAGTDGTDGTDGSDGSDGSDAEVDAP